MTQHIEPEQYLANPEADITRHSELVEGASELDAKDACTEAAKPFPNVQNLQVQPAPGDDPTKWDCSFDHTVE